MTGDGGRRVGGDRLLAAIALAEAATGLLLVAAPGLVSRLLLGAPVEGAGIATARVAGFALVGLSLTSARTGERLGMAAYSLGVALVLVLQATWAGAAGPLLWPAAGLHLALAALLWLRP